MIRLLFSLLRDVGALVDANQRGDAPAHISSGNIGRAVSCFETPPPELGAAYGATQATASLGIVFEPAQRFPCLVQFVLDLGETILCRHGDVVRLLGCRLRVLYVTPGSAQQRAVVAVVSGELEWDATAGTTAQLVEDRRRQLGDQRVWRTRRVA